MFNFDLKELKKNSTLSQHTKYFFKFHLSHFRYRYDKSECYLISTGSAAKKSGSIFTISCPTSLVTAAAEDRLVPGTGSSSVPPTGANSSAAAFFTGILSGDGISPRVRADPSLISNTDSSLANTRLSSDEVLSTFDECCFLTNFKMLLWPAPNVFFSSSLDTEI
jgi:hypothetical protein